MPRRYRIVLIHGTLGKTGSMSLTDRPESRRTDGPNFGRWVLLGGAFLLWNIVVLTLAILVTARTSGENIGKFVGTVGSAIAFVPPAWLVWRWYQLRAAADRQLQALFHFDSAETVTETVTETVAGALSVVPTEPASGNQRARTARLDE